MLAGGGEATVELVLIFFAVEHPHPQWTARQRLVSRKVVPDRHRDCFIGALGGFSPAAAADGGADRLADVVPAIQEPPRRDGCRVAPPRCGGLLHFWFRFCFRLGLGPALRFPQRRIETDVDKL